MPSILIHGGDKRAREAAARELLTKKGIEKEVHLIKLGEGEEKIGIEEIQTLLPHLHVRTRNERSILIFEAQRMTVAAQNALLKTLEEPPTHITFILTAPHPRLLLPTVVSRCLVTETQKERGTQGEAGTAKSNAVGEILNARPSQRLALFKEDYGYNQETIFSFLETAEAALGQQLNLKNTRRLEKLWQAKKMLREESANQKLVIDELLLSW